MALHIVEVRFDSILGFVHVGIRLRLWDDIAYCSTDSSSGDIQIFHRDTSLESYNRTHHFKDEQPREDRR